MDGRGNRGVSIGEDGSKLPNLNKAKMAIFHLGNTNVYKSSWSISDEEVAQEDPRKRGDKSVARLHILGLSIDGHQWCLEAITWPAEN